MKFNLLEKKIKGADGSKLATDIFLPEGDQFPVLLAMTPYGKHQFRAWGELLGEYGYAAAFQDVRGRFESEGEFDPIKQEKLDGPVTVRWLEKQPWFSVEKGIGILGISYLAQVGFSLAARSSKVKAMVNVGGLADFYDISHRGGATVIHHALPWTVITGYSKKQPDLKKGNWDRAFRCSNLEKADEEAGFPNSLWKRWSRHKLKDEYWAEWSVWSDLEKVDIPILHLTGWYDICLRSTLDLFEYFQERSSYPQQLFIGPWSHNGVIKNVQRLWGVDFGPESRSDFLKKAPEWFDIHLKGQSSGKKEEKAVNIFVTGTDKWYRTEKWPLEEGKEINFFLGEEKLSSYPETEGAKKFIFDPQNPVPTLGGTIWEFPQVNLEPGPADQYPISGRSDVLCFETPPLQEDLTLIGPVECTLFGSIDGESGDWVVRVVDVSPEGKRSWIADGNLRAHFRSGPHKESPVKPGEINEYRIDLWAIGHTFKKSHRLGLEISGSSFPKWDLNRHGLREGEVRRQKVFWGANYPSRLKTYSVSGRE